MTHRSPSRNFWNCSTNKHRNNGPNLAPPVGSSRIPPTHTSMLPGHRKYKFELMAIGVLITQLKKCEEQGRGGKNVEVWKVKAVEVLIIYLPIWLLEEMH